MKCHLCSNGHDPCHWIGVHDGYFPLCDGCSPAMNASDIHRVSDMCRKAGPPLTDVSPKFGYNDTREP
jgi:hypothetical protein